MGRGERASYLAAGASFRCVRILLFKHHQHQCHAMSVLYSNRFHIIMLKVLRNMQLSLKSLQRISGMGGLLDYFSAEDILSGRVSVWYVLHKLLHHNSGKKFRKHVKVIHASARTSAISHAFNNGSLHLAAADCAEAILHHSTSIDILEHIAESAAISITSKDSLSGCEGRSEGSGDTPKIFSANYPRNVGITAVNYTDSLPFSAVPSTPDTQQFIDFTDSLNPSSVGTASWSPDSQTDSGDFDESSEVDDGQNSQEICVANFDDDCKDEASKTDFRRLSTNDRALFEHLATLQEDMERLDQQYDQLNYQNDDHSDHPNLSHDPRGNLNYDIHRSEYELEGEIQKYSERSQQKTPLIDVSNILNSVRTVAGDTVREIVDMKDLHIADNLSRMSESPSVSGSVSRSWTASPMPPPPPAPLSPVRVLTIADDMAEALDLPCHSPPLDIDKKTEVVVADETEDGDNATVGITDISSPVSADNHHWIDHSNEDFQAANQEPIIESHEEGRGERGKQFISLLSLFSQVQGADPWSVEEPSLILNTPVKICNHDILSSSQEKPQDVDEYLLRKTSALTSISSAANNRSERFDAKVLNERLSCIADDQHQLSMPTESRRADVADSRRKQISGLTAASVTSENDERVKQNASKHDANKKEPDFLAEGGRCCDENKANKNVLHTTEKPQASRNLSNPLDTDMCTAYQSVITTPYDRNLWRLETAQRTGSDAFNHGELSSGSAASRLIDGLLPLEAEYLDKLASLSAVSEESNPLRYGAVDQDQDGFAPMTLARRMVVFRAKYSDATCDDSRTEVNNNVLLPVPVTDEAHPLPIETRREGQPPTVLTEGPVVAVPKQSPSSLVPPLRHSPSARTGEAEVRPSGIRKGEIPLSRHLSQAHRVRSKDDSTRAHNPVTASRYDDCRASKGARTFIEGSKKLRNWDSGPRAPPAGQSSPVSPSSDRLSRDSLEGFAGTMKGGTEHWWMPERKAMKSRNPRRVQARPSSKTGGEVRVRDIVVAPALPLLTCRRRVAAVATMRYTCNGDSKLNDVPTLVVHQSEPPIGYAALARKKKLSKLSKTVAVHNQSRAKKRSSTDWLPETDEVMDMMETHTLENQVVCGVTDGEVSEIKDWLLSLGLCILDREGGCGTYPLSSYGVRANSPGK